jgi:hypothetical protein
MRSTGPVEDRLAIRELCDLFGSAVIRADPEIWGSCWAEDAVWQIREGVALRGRVQIVARWTEVMNTLRLCNFMGYTGHVVVDGARAWGTYFRQETLYFKDGGTRTIIGHYDDEYIKYEGVWRISRRAGAVPALELVTGAQDQPG